MKKIAVLLDGSITNDGRVQRIIKSLSDEHLIDLYVCEKSKEDSFLFLTTKNKVNVYAFETRKSKLIDNLFFNLKYSDAYFKVIKNRTHYDVIYVNDYPLMQQGVLLKQKLGSILVYDSHEIYMETINQFFPTKGIKGILGKVLIAINRFYHGKKEARFLKQTDYFITVGDACANYFFEKYAKKAIVVRNCPLDIQLPQKNNSIREKLGLLQTDFIVIYQGVFNPGRNITKLLEAASFLNPNIHLVFMGWGPLKQEISNHIIDSKCSNIHLMQAVPYTELVKYSSAADLGIVLIEPINLSKKLSMPNKVFDYMAAGLPFLTNTLPEASKIAREENCGYIIEEANALALAQEINKLSIDISDLMQKGRNGFQAVLATYNWKYQFDLFMQKMK